MYLFDVINLYISLYIFGQTLRWFDSPRFLEWLIIWNGGSIIIQYTALLNFFWIYYCIVSSTCCSWFSEFVSCSHCMPLHDMRNSVISLRLKNWLMKDWRMANYDLWTTTRMFQVLVRPLLFVFWQFFLILTYIWFLQFLMHVMDTIYKLYTILAQPRTNKTYLDWLKKLLRIGVNKCHTRSMCVES